VPNTGHFVMLDDPDRLLAAIDGFLARHEVVAAQ
jgi:pimeloyl-ACP methyl ester carboxylesterase